MNIRNEIVQLKIPSLRFIGNLLTGSDQLASVIFFFF